MPCCSYSVTFVAVTTHTRRRLRVTGALRSGLLLSIRREGGFLLQVVHHAVNLVMDSGDEPALQLVDNHKGDVVPISVDEFLAEAAALVAVLGSGAVFTQVEHSDSEGQKGVLSHEFHEALVGAVVKSAIDCDF